MTRIDSFEDLIAWQRSVQLGLFVYRMTKRFPADERFALTSQITRAAVSVPSNIAEGFGRGSRREYIRSLRIARGSLYEVVTQLHIANELNYVSPNDHNEATRLTTECRKLLAGLIKALERPPK